MKLIKLQPAAHIDNIVDGHEMTRTPYPFYVHEDGAVGGDFWKGHAERVVGFQKDLYIQRVDLWWSDVAEDPQRAVGMYMVSVDGKGGMGVHETAIASVAVLAMVSSKED